MIILLKIDVYCSAEVADMSSNVNSLLIMHTNNPLHEYPEKYFKNNSYTKLNIHRFKVVYSLNTYP